MRRKTKNSKVKKFTARMQSKLLFVLCVIIGMMCVLIGRLVYLNNKDGERYEKRVLSQQSYVSSVVPYKRGTITDRNGIALAKSEKVYNVILDPKVLLTNESNVEPTLTAVSEVFGLDYSALYATLQEKSTSSYVILLKRQSYDLVSQFQERSSASKSIKGIWFEEEYFRTYPYESLASHVIGYTSAGNVGTWGIEQYYNSYLNGTNGRTYGYYDAELNLKRTEKQAVNGDTVVSTIDLNAQKIVEEHIAEFMETTGAKNIGVILMNPNTGEIYAMASNEGFNLNDPYDLTAFYSDEEIEAMDEETKLNNLNQIWRNFCVSDSYEPGSTFKPITVAAALEEGLVTPESTFLCNGYEHVGGWRINCNNKSGHGYVTLAESLMKSCNPALMKMGALEGNSMFINYQKHFGLGSTVGIDLPGESTGILLKESAMSVTDLATASFGQTFNVTMVQMVAAFSSLVNGGYYYQPHVVKEIINEKGATVFENNGVLLKETVSQATSEFIREAMYLTVEAGTAKPAQVQGYLVGGKTGTAQKLPRSAKKYVVSFIGCVPTNDPQLVSYVVIDEVDDEEKKASSTVATQMTSAILGDVLPFLGIYPDGEIEYDVELPVNEHTEAGEETTAEDGENGAREERDGGVVYDPSEDEQTVDAVPEMSSGTGSETSGDGN
ncbi:MAG: penicillin-binding protein 2 [Lachnospiraceae bacterium]|nr:penicillin-binding protein 2 [Lachnospiraceae bacterium]